MIKPDSNTLPVLEVEAWEVAEQAKRENINYQNTCWLCDFSGLIPKPQNGRMSLCNKCRLED